MKDVTYKVFIALMNGLCEGLGDLIDQRSNLHAAAKNFADAEPISFWFRSVHHWNVGPEGFDKWSGIYDMLVEIEKGEGVKKELPNIKEAVVGSNMALVVYFDGDVAGRFGQYVKDLAASCGLQIVCILGNTMVVSHIKNKGSLLDFQIKLGINKR